MFGVYGDYPAFNEWISQDVKGTLNIDVVNSITNYLF
jgi:hypothetical protein